MKQNEFSISERTGKIKEFIEKQHGGLLSLETAMILGRGEERKQKAEVERVCDL